MSNNVTIETTKLALVDRTAVLFRVTFDDASNDRIVRDVSTSLAALVEIGGKLSLLDVPVFDIPASPVMDVPSMPIAMVLAHYLGHRFGAVAMRDPNMGEGAYVVVISHDPDYAIGGVILV